MRDDVCIFIHYLTFVKIHDKLPSLFLLDDNYKKSYLPEWWRSGKGKGCSPDSLLNGLPWAVGACFSTDEISQTVAVNKICLFSIIHEHTLVCRMQVEGWRDHKTRNPGNWRMKYQRTCWYFGYVGLYRSLSRKKLTVFTGHLHACVKGCILFPTRHPNS